MKFTYAWIKEYLNTNASVTEICEALTSAGLEVESIEDNGAIYSAFVVAEIISAEPHPDAERLKICKVNDGAATIQVVCGGKNARAGIKVVLAPVGSIIPTNNMQIKASKIRGVESNGMLCAADELALENESDGIMELDDNAILGQKFAEYANLNDTIIDVALTPNRGDAASVYGIARDLHALGFGELKRIEKTTPLPKINAISIDIQAQKACYEFTATIVEGVNNAPKTIDIDSFLKLIGHNIKSPLVSISNFTMFAYGRPNHMYDLDKIKGGLSIRFSEKDEKFTPLGMEELTIPEGLLVVADNEKILAIAGVIGGELSKVDEYTKNIVIEVANFCPIEVAKAGRALNIHTDARFRFERRVDTANTEACISDIVARVTKDCGGVVKGTTAAQGVLPDFVKEVPLVFENINKLCGQEIEQQTVLSILNALGFEINEGIAKVPSFRFGDINNQVDLAEEVIRVYGLNNIKKQPFNLSPDDVSIPSSTCVEKLRHAMISFGFDELITWTFVSEEYAKIFGFADPIKVANPISADMSVMRQSIVPMLLDAAIQNASQSIRDISIFEIGSAYFNAEKKEALHIAALKTGVVNRKTFHDSSRAVDYFDAKQMIEQMILSYGLDPANLTFNKVDKDYYHPGKSAAICLGKKVLGYCGELHPKILKDLGFEDAVIAAELYISNMPEIRQKNAKQKLVLSNLQQVSRDFAFVVDKEMPVGQLLKSIKGCATSLIESVSIFDIYMGKNIEDSKKSVAVNVLMRPQDETMTDTKIEEICQKIISFVEKEYSAELR